ncbi:RICIN domain-containing protein [Nocardia vulneris]|uniref:RICIN domain-containing protein n=1 Tax=Nocardia vulneris TaxID=1141657 RepID=UPI0030D26BAD
MRTKCLGRILPAAIVLAAATTVLVGQAPSSAAEPGSGDVVRLSFDGRSPDAEDEDLRCMNLDADTSASAASCEPAATASRQRWEWKIVADGFVQLKNVATGLCLDSGGESGIVYGFSCSADNANQRFRYHLRGTATRLIGGDSRYACPDIVFGDDKVRMTSENRRCLNDGGLWQVAVLG